MTGAPRRPGPLPGGPSRRTVLSLAAAAVVGGTSGCALLPTAPTAGMQDMRSGDQRPLFDGPYDIRRDETVIEGMQITKPLTVAADNVVIRNCLVQAATGADEPLIFVQQGSARTVLERNELRGPAEGGGQAAGGVWFHGDSASFVGNDVSGIAGMAILLAGTDAVIRDNRVHDFAARRRAVFGGIAWDGSEARGSVTISGNQLELWPAGATSALIALPDQAEEVIVTHNWLAGGAYALLGGGHGVSVTNNQFSTKFARTCGKLGMHGYLGDHFPKGLMWTDNAWADGPEVGDVVEP